MDKSYELTDEKVDELVSSWLGTWSAKTVTVRGLIRGAEQETRKKLLSHIQEHNSWPRAAELMDVTDPGHLMLKAEDWRALLADHGIEL